MQGSVINSPGSRGSSMDGAATSAAGASVTAAQSESKPGTVTGVVTVVSDATSAAGNPAKTGVQTLNGSTMLMNCHIPGGASADSSGNNSQSAVTLVNNGPVSAPEGSAALLSPASSTIARTSLTSAQNTVTSPVITPQPSGKSVPTVTLVRPPMQTPIITSQSGGNPVTVVTPPAVTVTSTTGSIDNKLDSTKLVSHTSNVHVVASVVTTGTTATMRSPTVLQNLRTSVPSTVAASPPAGIRAIAPQLLAPRLTQPQQTAPNVQNIQLPPGNSDVKATVVSPTN